MPRTERRRSSRGSTNSSMRADIPGVKKNSLKKSGCNVISKITFELSGIGANHLDECRYFAVSNIGKTHQSFHTAENVLLTVLGAEKLQNCHSQFCGYVIKNLFIIKCN